MDFTPCDRREAVELLAAGIPRDAALILASLPNYYVKYLQDGGINLASLHHILKPVMAALKVLAEASLQTGNAVNGFSEGGRDRSHLDRLLAGRS